MPKQLQGTLMMLFAAMIWGLSFVAQSAGMEFIGPFTFQAARQALGVIVLLPFIYLRDRKNPNDPLIPRTPPQKKRLLLSGIICGTLMFALCSFQQIGLTVEGFTVGKSGFITALYVLFTPLVAIFLGRKPHPLLAVASVTALAGLYLLCVDGPIRLGMGEIYTLLCAFVSAFHILYLDHVVTTQDGVRLAAAQMAVSAALSLLIAIIFEHPSMQTLAACWLPIVYSGVFSCGIAFTMQILAQKLIGPTLLAITMCMESVFAAIFGWLILGEIIPLKGIIGCVLMFIGILLGQLFGTKKE